MIAKDMKIQIVGNNVGTNPKPSSIVNPLIEQIFPELKKPEDEEIRKTIIHLIEHNIKDGFSSYDSIKYSDMIDWLRKQEQKKIPIWKHWKNGIAGNGEGKLVYLIKDGSTYSLSSCLSFECDYIELSELENLWVI